MNIKQIVNDVLKEASSTSRNSEYISPLLPGYREFEKHMNGPFTEYVTGWDDPLLDHDSLDGKMSYSKKTIKKREKRAEKIARFIKNNPDSFAWDGDAGVLNGLPGQNTDAKPIKNFDPKKTTVSLDGKTKRKTVKEATSDSTNAKGSFVPPLQTGIRYFKKNVMGPFTDPVSDYKSPDLEYDSYDGKMERTKKQRKKEETKALVAYNKIKNSPNATFSDEDGNIINQTPGKGKTFVPIREWVELDTIELNEDLAVWFGKKKKPKGSNQPKGPWVNICRKVDGKHPPCGRSDTSKGAYPKCRAAGVAGKMSDSEKRSACQQKRRAEKKDTQTGKGQKPIMTSYKKKKTNEDMKKVLRLTESELIRIIKTVIKEQTGPLNIDPNQQISLTCRNSMGQRISFDGTVETSSRNASWGTVDPDTNIYSESEETVPEFFVTKKEEFGVTEGQDITKSFYIAPITAEMSAFLGITGGTVLLHYKNGSPIGNKDIRSNRFYCRVVSTDNQFGNELRRHQVNGGI